MIELFRSLSDFRYFRNKVTHQSIGLVPTMGNLHAGHLSLIEESLSENDLTIVTIFVNPKQFGPDEDYEEYPRTLEKDLQKIQMFQRTLPLPAKQLVVFSPAQVNDIYPKNYSTTITLGDVTTKLCGKSRPGHFDGVTTVVYQLFSITRPQAAYFGQKDYQQFAILSRMVEDLSLPVELEMMPIIRDENGLALSSRNQYLSDEDYSQALYLPQTLAELQNFIEGRNWEDVSKEVEKIIDQKIFDPSWDYLQVLDAISLEAPTSISTQVLIAAAYRIGKTRLIDNILVEVNNA
jgi:pantoate--beta-alanine ligase